jgi:hypothetical protein
MGEACRLGREASPGSRAKPPDDASRMGFEYRKANSRCLINPCYVLNNILGDSQSSPQPLGQSWHYIKSKFYRWGNVTKVKPIASIASNQQETEPASQQAYDSAWLVLLQCSAPPCGDVCRLIYKAGSRNTERRKTSPCPQGVYHSFMNSTNVYWALLMGIGKTPAKFRKSERDTELKAQGWR